MASFFTILSKHVTMKQYILGIATVLTIAACNNNNGNNNGHSTPIDSTNVNGTAPATYGPEDPKNDTAKTNVNDTGTNANNVHNAGR